ncbi:SAM-dependent methyltransferase [Streptosporangium album]|uniref:SAM-dependent methyltransferase n=1 Tax=Streptosporangium album TaxID=47479 RepID=A0A7W7W9V7_9ACTN|nr:methyltransferase domain-containing protein [Streptosporangium album]MBB4938474.1 SAM-dependent methyltransferase [Streptosporangium album]
MSNTIVTPQEDDPVSGLIRLLDAVDALPSSVALRAHSYGLLDLAPGAPVVDVGCGVGRAVAEMAEHGAEAVGVDVSEQMIAVGRRRRPGADLRVGDAYALPFQDGQLAGYRAEKVYHELGDPARALGEARRVLAPGGRIVLIGQDWDTFVIDSDHPGLTRTIVHARADTIAAPRAARGYRNLLLDAGFDDVAVEVRTGVFSDELMLPALSGIADAACAAGAITPDQAATWTAEQAGRARDGRLFMAVPLFVAAARRP